MILPDAIYVTPGNKQLLRIKQLLRNKQLLGNKHPEESLFFAPLDQAAKYDQAASDENSIEQ